MGIDPNKLKEKFDKKSSQGKDRFEFKDGDNYIRILPPSVEYMAETVDYISYDYLMHYNVGMDGDTSAEVCPKTHGKQHKCPICEAVYRHYRANTAEEKDIGGKLRAKTRYIFNIIDLNDIERGIQVMETGPLIYNDIVKYVSNPKWGDMLDLDKGHNFTITKTDGKKTESGYTQYEVTPDPDIVSIRSKLPKNFKEVLESLRKQTPEVKTYDDLKILLEGGAPESGKGATSNKPEPIQESKVEPKAEFKESSQPEKPKCFGEEYGPRKDDCVKCIVMKECRKQFFEV